MRKITEAELRNAVVKAGLPEDTFERISLALGEPAEAQPGFETAHVAYYLGALLIIGAMGWFVTTAWDSLSGMTISRLLSCMPRSSVEQAWFCIARPRPEFRVEF